MADIILDALAPGAKPAPRLNPFDLEQDKKKVRSLLKTAEGREALRLEMGYNFLWADDALKDERPLVSLLVPSRTGAQPECQKAVEAMIVASRPYCILNLPPAVSQSVIHWSRNELLVRLRKSQQPADYVLLMDDDMTPPPDALTKMLGHHLDIVAGSCTVRKDPPKPNFRTWVPEVFNFCTTLDWPIGTLFEVGGVGTAFMLVKTTVLDTIGEYYLSCCYEREFLGMNEEVAKKMERGRREHARKTGNEWWFRFLPHPWGDGEYGEDLSFCFCARQCGYKIFVDDSIWPGHIGSYEYKIADYLSYQADEIAKAQAEGNHG